MPLKADLRTAALLLALAATAPLLAQNLLPAHWKAELRQADKQLRAQQWQEAGKKAREGGLTEMVENAGTRIEAAHSLAVATALLAIAEAGLGYQDDAEWLWDSALNLDPSIAQTDVAGYGPAAAELRKRSLRSKAKERQRRPLSTKTKSRPPASSIRRSRTIPRLCAVLEWQGTSPFR